MLMALIFLLVPLAIILILSPYFLIGFIILGVVSLLWKSHTNELEERFVAFLAVMAFLGVVATLVEDFIGRWLLS